MHLTTASKVHFEYIDDDWHAQYEQMNLTDWIDQGTPYDTGSVMQYGSYGYAAYNYTPTMTYVEDGVDTGVPVEGQRDGASSMDIWQICKLYGCGKCNGFIIDSYDGDAYKNYMNKCTNADRYYWSSR